MRLFQFLLLIALVVNFQSCGTDVKASDQELLRTRDQITDYNPNNDERPLNELIQIDEIYPGSIISSPYRITGKANNAWYFERSFPVKLKDENGNVLYSSPAIALSSQRSPGWVPFKVDIIFIAAPGTEARLVFELHNPSDTEGFQRAIEVPVVLK